MEKKNIIRLIKIIIWIAGLYASTMFSLHTLYFIISGFYFMFTNLGKREEGTLSAYSVFNDNFERLAGTMDGLTMFKSNSAQQEIPAARQTKKKNIPLQEIQKLKGQYFKNQSKYGNKSCFCGSQVKFKKCCLISQPNEANQEHLIYFIQRLIYQMFDYKARVYLITFSCYVSIHALRTTYSFSKGLIADTVQVEDSELGIVDSLMLYALSLGFFQQTILPFSRPVLALNIGLFLTAFFYILVPILLNAFLSQSFTILCILMCFDGYFQSYSWPNLLMLVNSQYDNKKQSLLLGIWSASTNVGNIIGFILCQFLVIQTGMDWAVGMIIIGLYVIFNGFLVCFGIKELPKEDAVPAQQYPLISEDNTEGKDIKAIESQPRTLQNISKLLKSPLVILMTITFSLVKSIEYGILLWLPMYFNLVGLVDYSAYIPITFDVASIFSSIALGYAFKKIENKGVLLGPLIFLLMILFYLLRWINASVAGYYIMVAGVGLCLGGSYNTLAGLVAMELVKVVDPRYRTKYLGFYSAVLMCVANLITATTQILLGYVIGKNEYLIFTIFFWYSTVTLILLICIGILDRVKDKQQEQSDKKQSYIQIVETHG